MFPRPAGLAHSPVCAEGKQGKSYQDPACEDSKHYREGRMTEGQKNKGDLGRASVGGCEARVATPRLGFPELWAWGASGPSPRELQTPATNNLLSSTLGSCSPSTAPHPPQGVGAQPRSRGHYRPERKGCHPPRPLQTPAGRQHAKVHPPPRSPRA